MAVQTVSGDTEEALRTGFEAVRRNLFDTDILAVLGARLTQAGRPRKGRPLLLRAAELTVSSGYDWFATAERATDRDTRFYGTRDPWYGDRYGPFWSPAWRFSRSGAWSPFDRRWGNDFDVRQVDRYEASAEIVMGRGTKPAGDPNAFEAREVIVNVGPRIARAN